MFDNFDRNVDWKYCMSVVFEYMLVLAYEGGFCIEI